MPIGSQDLKINGEPIQTLYNAFVGQRYFVNRRYQRKLVWTVEEKERFIDSLSKTYPVPLILLAETKINDTRVYEIIDGMQRLNATFSFIQNEFPYLGKYFDLQTLADTKAQLESGVLEQKTPLLERDKCLAIANYVVPVSIYLFENERDIDEVFRRINASGRHLSRQELRSAGSLGNFSQTVRVLSANIRGDSSPSDVFEFSKMKHISINNINLDYGINVADIFWVKNKIITKQDLRESRDEEIVADLISSMVLPTLHSTNQDVLNDYFGFAENRESFDEIESNVARVGQEIISSDFLRVFDQIQLIISNHGHDLSNLIFKSAQQRAPRNFYVLFMALHKLIIKESKEILDMRGLLQTLGGIATDHMIITEGGNWSAKNREQNIDAIVGIISKHFGDGVAENPSVTVWNTKVENILSQSFIEQQLYDFKQGFSVLDGSFSFDTGCFDKVIKTLTAMCNIGPKKTCFVIIGIADKKSDADRVKALFNSDYLNRNGKYITGIEHEAIKIKGSLEPYFNHLGSLINAQPISEDDKREIKQKIKLIKYFDKALVVFSMESGLTPKLYNKDYWTREMTDIRKLEAVEMASLFEKFKAK